MGFATTVSTIGLLFCLLPGLLHAVEVVFPMLSRWVVNYVLPLFELAPRSGESGSITERIPLMQGLPPASSRLTEQDQLTMLDAALKAVPNTKTTAASDYVFLMIFEQRQGSLAFHSLNIGVIYGLFVPLEQRIPLHIICVVLSVLLMLANANQGDVPILKFMGDHPKVSPHGRNVGIVFTPLWGFVALLNMIAWASSIPK